MLCLYCASTEPLLCVYCGSSLTVAILAMQVAPHSVTITPRKVDMAERGPLTEQAYEPGLRIPAHSSTKAKAKAAAAPANPNTPLVTERLSAGGDATQGGDADAEATATQAGDATVGEGSAALKRRTPGSGKARLGTFDQLSGK